MPKKITREMVDEATVPTLKEYCEAMGVEVKSSDRKDNLVRKLKLAITKAEKEATAAPKPKIGETPGPAPAPAPAVPAATAADPEPEKKKLVVEPGSVKPLPTFKYFIGGNKWEKEISREEAIRRVTKLGAAGELIARLEKKATSSTPARWRTSVPMRGRLPSSLYLRVQVRVG